MLSNQFATLNDLSEFPTELAASRTFVFVREVEMLLQNNLIKGGDLDNAIVIYDQKVSQEVLDNLADKLSIPHKDVQTWATSTINRWYSTTSRHATS